MTKVQRQRLSDVTPRVLRARYDAAQTNEENRRHWSAVDGMSAAAANNAGVRTILRNRSRYVFANNPRARGMMMTLGIDTAGVGPRLQLDLGTGTVARRLADRTEASFGAWARAIGLAKKLRLMRVSRIHSGEIFSRFYYNPRVEHDIKLDFQLIEADQVHSPDPMPQENEVDGVLLDEWQNPIAYTVLRNHPGDINIRGLSPLEYEIISTDNIWHYYLQDRPHQFRGIPEIASAVQVFEEGRRFRAAVLAAAETAADFAMAIQSDAPPDPDANEVEAMDEIELKRRMATVLPQGWKLTQTRAEQPTTTFKEFSRELLSEVARCLQMPLTIAALDSSESNLSAAYLDHQTYAKSIRVERAELESFLNITLDKWLTMAIDPMVNHLGRRTPHEWPHAWFWPAIGEHADPAKVAKATVEKLGANLTTLMDEYANRGMDWETALRQRAREKELMEELGISSNEAAPSQVPAGEGDNDERDE